MKRMFVLFTFSIILILGSCKKKSQIVEKEVHMKQITNHIIATKKAIIEKENCKENCIFLTFWDFDGTILKGDCSEGYKLNNKKVYSGLVELSIKEGLSKLYSKQEYEQFWKKYEDLDHKKGHYASYTYLTQIFAGAKEKEIKSIAKSHIDKVLQKYFFASSIQMFNLLRKEKIQNFVVSASPDFFVKPLSSFLNISEEQLYGIEVEVNHGFLTNKILKPVNFAEGKTKKIQKIIKSLKKKNLKKKIFILAGFGNSYTTDGEFLAYIAKQKLPVGETISVMINGGETPEKYKGLFRKVNQSKTVE